MTLDIWYLFLYIAMTCVSIAFLFVLAVVAISAVVERIKVKYAKK